MISWSSLWSSASFQVMRAEFWLISSPDTATPPAFAALLGANNTFAAMNAPRMPLAISVLASFVEISFWVAQGKARSAVIPQGRPSRCSQPNSYEVYVLRKQRNSDRLTDDFVPNPISTKLVLDLHQQVATHLRRIWWDPESALTTGKLFSFR